MALGGHPIEYAASQSCRADRRFNVIVGCRAVIETRQPAFHRPAHQSWAQQARRGKEWGGRLRHGARRIRHDELRVAGASDQRDIVDAERPWRDVLRERLDVVDVDVDRRGNRRNPAQRRQRHGDQVWPQGEIALRLKSADAKRTRPRQVRR